MPYILTESGDRLIVESGLFALVTEDTAENVLNAVLLFDVRPRSYVRRAERSYLYPATSRTFLLGV